MTTEKIFTKKWIQCSLCLKKRPPWMIDEELKKCRNCRQMQARKMRSCLQCDHKFLSESSQNRICGLCKKSYDYATTVLGMGYFNLEK